MKVKITGTLEHGGGINLTPEEVKRRILEQMGDKCFLMNDENIPYKVTVWLKDIEAEIE